MLAPASRLVPPILHHTLPSSAQRLLVELALVEGELLALQDVAIATAGLAGAARDDGVKTTGLELLLDSGVDLARGGEAGSLLSLDGLALLDLLDSLALLLLATATKGLAVVGLVPLTEGRSVDLDDGGLGQGVRADKLVVRGVVWISKFSLSSPSNHLGANVQATPMTRVLRVHPSEAQAKLPESRRSARYLWLPPRVRTV